MNIKNIIFDLGGVLINIDYQATIKAFQDLGIRNFDELFSQLKQDQIFDKWDIGGISPQEFRNELRNITGIAMTDESIDQAWNAMLGHLPPYKIPMLDQVSQNYRTFLLSNTNAIHIPFFRELMRHDHGLDGLEAFFEKLYYSHEIGMRKPDTTPFEMIIRENRIKPEETLFFDDTLMHVQGARKAGLHAYWIDLQKEDVVEYFENGQLTADFFQRHESQLLQSHQ